MRAAVLGSPISHSLSPVLHRAGYGALGLTDWTYDRFELVADELPTFLSGLDASWRGLSLTMPLKAACLEVAEVVTDRARRAGVGNTLVRLPSRGWLADNTDVAGLVAALAPVWHPGWTRAAILGAGATARSAILALAELGVREVVIYARTPAKAEPLVAWSPGELAVSVRPLEAWTRGAEPVVISTLPGGAADTLAFPRSAPAELCEERPDTPQPVSEGAGDERA
ncbi:MAG TPA: shikimate dehydrogenase, partial [Propionicimonas sp.]|nr:shikimate dehydrogenase [Propionicimonas sp.]